jgi:hypothetical protein
MTELVGHHEDCLTVCNGVSPYTALISGLMDVMAELDDLEDEAAVTA